MEQKQNKYQVLKRKERIGAVLITELDKVGGGLYRQSIQVFVQIDAK